MNDRPDAPADQDLRREGQLLYLKVMAAIQVFLVIIALADVYLVEPDIDQGPGGWHAAAIGWGAGELALIAVTVGGWRLLGRAAAESDS